jgi:hypothetical protein
VSLVLGPPVAPASDFGASVSIGTGFAVVGAPSANAVFVYRTAPAAAEAIATLRSPDAISGDSFGTSVSLSRSGRWIVAGAPHRDEGGTSNKGAVYVFRHSSGMWSFHSKINSNLAGQNDRFGWSVSVDDSVGVVRVLVGCNYNVDFSGFVEVFEMPSTGDNRMSPCLFILCVCVCVCVYVCNRFTRASA